MCIRDRVIANRVTVDRHATLRDSVVLSDAYIGERLEVRNAIIQGNRLIQVDTGAVLSMICLLYTSRCV